MTFNESLQIFIKNQSIRGNSNNTIKDYKTKLSYALAYFGDIEVESFTSSNCGDYLLFLRQRVNNTVSLQSYIRSFRAYLNFLYQSGYIQEDICNRFKLPKARRGVMRVLSDAECCELLSVFDLSSEIGLRNYCIVALMLDSGVRLSEVVSLRRTDINLAEHYAIVNGKGDKLRYVSFGSGTSSALTRYFSMVASSWAFVGFDGECVTVSAIKNMFRKLKVKSGVGIVHAHLLRHTFATRYLENGGHIYELKELLGHSTLRMTQNYLHNAQTRISKDFDIFSPLNKIIGKSS